MAKYKAYPEYKDSGVEWLGEIPEKWNTHSLKRSISSCTSGLWGEEPNGKNDIIILRVADFERNSLTISSDKLTMRAISSEEREIRLLKKGDLIIEKSGGGDKTLVGCVVVFEKSFNAITSNFVAKMSPLKGYQPHFLKYCFSHLYDGKINSLSIKQTTGIQNIDINHYLMRKFCFPNEKQQKIIYEFLDYQIQKFNTLIAKQQQLIELLKEKRQAVISHAVTKGLNPDAPMKDSGVEWLGKIPTHWIVCHLKQLAKIRNGQDYKSIESETGFPVIGSGGQFSYAKNYMYDKPSVLLGRKGTIDKPLYMDSCFWVVDTMFYTEVNKNIIAKYLYYISTTIQFDKYSTNTALPSMTQENLGNYSLCYSLDPDEQQNILDIIELKTTKIDTLIQKQLQQIELLKERRTALIAAAVTGKIDLRDWTPPGSSSEESLTAEEATA